MAGISFNPNLLLANRVAIDIDVPDMALKLGLTQYDLSEFMREIAEEAAEYWKTLANESLTSTAKWYTEAIVTRPMLGGAYRVVLDTNYVSEGKGPLIAAIEFGADSYDMKPGFLKGGMNRRLIPLWKGHPTHGIEPVWLHKDDDGWTHPGWDGQQMYLKVMTHLDNVILPAALDKLADAIVKELS